MFGKRLKELREKNNFSMDKLIELYNEKYDAKMNKSTLSRYENELQDPIYTVVVNLADFFNVTVDYISGGNSFPITKEGNATPYDTTTSKDPVIEKYNTLNLYGKKKVESYIDDLLINEKYTVPYEHNELKLVAENKNSVPPIVDDIKHT